MTTDFESIADKNDAKDHIVLGGEETDRRMENVDNNTQFDANEDIIKKREVQKLMLFDKVYINQVPNKILDRWVPLGAGVLQPPTPYMLIYTPFDTLLNTDYIKQALKTFFYLRAKVEVKIVYSTSIWNYGAVFISNISGGSSTVGSTNYAWINGTGSGAAGTDFGKMLSHNPIILDLSQQEEVIFDLPWISPANYISLKAFYDTGDDANTATVNFCDNLFRFAIFQPFATGALDSTVTTAFNFNLFARFQDVTVQGFTFDATASSGLVEAQSAFVMSTLGGLAAQATPVVSSWLKTQADKAIKVGLGKAEGFLEGYLDQDEEKKVMETSDKRVEVDRQTSNILPDMYGDLVANNQMCKAVLPARPTPSSWHRVTDFLQKPSFIGSFVYPGEGSAPLYSFIPIPNASEVGTATTDRIAYLGQYARFWRGSIIYTFLLMTSPMVSVKFKILLTWNTNDSVVGEPESLLTRIVTVRGTTVVDIPVPFLYSQQWLPTDLGIAISDLPYLEGPVNAPALWIQRYQPAYSPGDIPATVHLHVWRRAGKDFAFSSLREAGSYTGDTPLVVDAQMRVTDLLNEDVALLGASDSLVFQGRDVIEFLEDIASRFSCDQNSTTTYPTPLDWNTSNGRSNIDTISNLFYYFRGSVDFKFIVSSPGTSTRVAVVASPYTDKVLRAGFSALNSVSDGEVAIDPRFTGVLEYRQPALALYDWIELPSDGTAYYPMTNALPVLYDVLTDGTGVIFEFCLRKITADSSFYYEIPPPYSTVWASA